MCRCDFFLNIKEKEKDGRKKSPKDIFGDEKYRKQNNKVVKIILC